MEFKNIKTFSNDNKNIKEFYNAGNKIWPTTREPFIIGPNDWPKYAIDNFEGILYLKNDVFLNLIKGKDKISSIKYEVKNTSYLNFDYDYDGFCVKHKGMDVVRLKPNTTSNKTFVDNFCKSNTDTQFTIWNFDFVLDESFDWSNQIESLCVILKKMQASLIINFV